MTRSVAARVAVAIGLGVGASALGCGLLQADETAAAVDAGSLGDGRADAVSNSNRESDASVVVATDGSVAKPLDRTLCTSDLDCVRSDAVGICVALVGGAFRVCSFPAPAPQPCRDAGGPFGDQCCGATTSTCLTGVCTLQVSCGGAFIAPHNICVSDECSKNTDCGARGVCLPTGAGSGSHRTCLRSNDCVSDAECSPTGACVLVGSVGPSQQCEPFSCGPVPVQVATKMACIFGDDCRDDGDCPKQHCEALKLGGQTRLRCAPSERSHCPPPP